MSRHSNAGGCDDGLEAHHDEQSHQDVMTAGKTDRSVLLQLRNRAVVWLVM